MSLPGMSRKRFVTRSDELRYKPAHCLSWDAGKPATWRERIVSLSIALVLLALLLIVGSLDYQDAQAERRHYCDQVAAGVWPDYRRTYAAECGSLKAHDSPTSPEGPPMR